MTRPASTSDRNWRDHMGQRDLLQTGLFLWLAAMLALALTLGAGTRGRELTTLALQLMGLATLPVVLFRLSSRWKNVEPWPILLCALMLLVPLIQLIPLPADLWASLPGRALAAQTLRVADVPLAPHPLSLTPDATWAAFLWILPAASLFLAALCLSERRYRDLFVVTMGFLVLGTVLAAIQHSTSLRWPTHPFSNNDFPVGFFANKNHQAGALAVGLPLAAAIGLRWRSASPRFRHLGAIVYIGLTLVLVGGIVVTRSRAGLIMGGLGVVAGGLIYWRGLYAARLGPRAAWVLVLTLLAIAAVGGIGGVATINRFSEASGEERRLDSWPTIFSAAKAAQPTGTGLGSFDPVYRSVELADTMSRQYVNEAHNEYLQLWLEAGIAFPILLGLFAAWLATRVVGLVRAPPGRDRSYAWAALSGIVILMAHSSVDYPMRTQALICAFALFCAGLARREKATA